MKLLNRTIIFIVTIILMLVAGCHNKVYNQSNGNVADVADRAKQALQKSDADAKPQPSLIVNSGLYVDKTPINLAKQPGWLKNYIIIRGDDLPFSYYSRTIVNGGDQNGRIAQTYRDDKSVRAFLDYKSTKASSPVQTQSLGAVLTRYQVGLDPNIKFSMNYSGTVKGALDALAAKTGYVYLINGNDVYWQAFVTKTFNIAFMPGTSDYMMGKGSGSTSNGAGSASVSGPGGMTTTGFLDDSSSSQYSNLKGTLSIWKDVDSTIKQLISPEGKVVVSEATTSVTVRDKASNVELVGQYIENLNRNLSSQVLVKVEVLDIDLSSDFNFGINWQAVQRHLGKGSNLVINANYGTPITIKNLSGGGNPQFGLTPEDATKNNFSPLINALEQQGRVAVVSEPRVVCLNNQVSAVRIVNQEGYLASVQITSFGGTSTTPANAQSNSVTSQITPGTVITGLTLYILPKILGNKVYLQVNADLSTNNGFGKISSTGVESTIAKPQTTIQVPNLSQKQFNQRSVVESGETLVLSGYRQVKNHTATQELLGSADLGGRAAQQENIETVVLITPIILHGCA